MCRLDVESDDKKEKPWAMYDICKEKQINAKHSKPCAQMGWGPPAPCPWTWCSAKYS